MRTKPGHKVFFATTMLAVSVLLISGCSKAKVDCTSFGKQFDQLQAATAVAAAAIANRGVCHSQVEGTRRAECPEYYTWQTTAKRFAQFVADEKAGCISDSDKASARADLADLSRPDAFPVK